MSQIATGPGHEPGQARRGRKLEAPSRAQDGVLVGAVDVVRDADRGPASFRPAPTRRERSEQRQGRLDGRRVSIDDRFAGSAVRGEIARPRPQSPVTVEAAAGHIRVHRVCHQERRRVDDVAAQCQ